MSEKKEKLLKVELKLRKKHPRKTMKLQRHDIGMSFQTYELNEAEVKELNSKGGKSWFISKEEFEKAAEAAKKAAKKK